MKITKSRPHENMHEETLISKLNELEKLEKLLVRNGQTSIADKMQELALLRQEQLLRQEDAEILEGISCGTTD